MDRGEVKRQGPEEGSGVKAADLALVEQLRQGDPSAFDTFVRQHQKELYRLAYRMTRNAEDAKDLSQEAFLRAYRGLQAFDGRCRLATWLYRITVNLCLSHLKDRHRTGEELPEAQADLSPDSLEQLEAKEQGQMVSAAIATLPPQQRATLLLRVHHGLPYREIAEILECSEGTAKANYFHAVAKLRKSLGGSGQGRESHDL